MLHGGIAPPLISPPLAPTQVQVFNDGLLTKPPLFITAPPPSTPTWPLNILKSPIFGLCVCRETDQCFLGEVVSRDPSCVKGPIPKDRPFLNKSFWKLVQCQCQCQCPPSIILHFVHNVCLVSEKQFSAPDSLWARAVDNPLLYRSSVTHRRPRKKRLRNEELWPGAKLRIDHREFQKLCNKWFVCSLLGFVFSVLPSLNEKKKKRRGKRNLEEKERLWGVRWNR